MTDQHTPGPWYCEPDDTQHNFPARQQVFGGGFLLAEVAGNGKSVSGANARLIAAAPELLAALIDLLPHARKHIEDLNSQMVGNLYPAINRAKLDRAEAAIAKATRPS